MNPSATFSVSGTTLLSPKKKEEQSVFNQKKLTQKAITEQIEKFFNDPLLLVAKALKQNTFINNFHLGMQKIHI